MYHGTKVGVDYQKDKWQCIMSDTAEDKRRNAQSIKNMDNNFWVCFWIFSYNILVV